MIGRNGVKFCFAIGIIAASFSLSACGFSPSERDLEIAEYYGIDIDQYMSNKNKIDEVVSMCRSKFMNNNREMGFKVANGSNYKNVRIENDKIYVKSDDVVFPLMGNSHIDYKCSYEISTNKYDTDFNE